MSKCDCFKQINNKKWKEENKGIQHVNSIQHSATIYPGKASFMQKLAKREGLEAAFRL